MRTPTANSGFLKPLPTEKNQSSTEKWLISCLEQENVQDEHRTFCHARKFGIYQGLLG